MRSLIIAAMVALTSTTAFARNINLTVDGSKAIHLKTAATGVVVGNAGVADVIVHDPNVLLFLGKSVGRTHVLVIGVNKRTIFEGDINVRATEAAGTLTVMRGTDTQTSICNTRCISVPGNESTGDGLNSAVANAKARSGFANGK